MSTQTTQSRMLTTAADAAFATFLQNQLNIIATAAKANMLSELQRELKQSGFSQADQNTIFTTVTTAITNLFATW